MLKPKCFPTTLLLLSVPFSCNATSSASKPPSHFDEGKVASEIRTKFSGRSRTLASLGAIGDGVTDDTAALRQALANSSSQCLDGQGRSYRVRGTLRTEHDLCLQNAKLVQDVVPFDTRRWIRGACPPVNNPGVVASCGDPPMAKGVLPRGLSDYLTTRTLLVRPNAKDGSLSVYLRNVKIDRGGDPSSGSRDDAAGLWIDNARRVVLQDVEITGGGKGFGLMIADSTDIAINRLHVHDLVWAPYAGDTPLTLPRLKAQGLNTVPIREFRQAGRQGAQVTGFQGVRVQEQVTCAMFARAHHVVLWNTRIDGCLARFAEGDFAWQADGIHIGVSSSDVNIAGQTSIANTWEGIDIVGGGSGVRKIFISGATIRNSFAYGIKLGYDLSGVVAEDNRIERAGLAGVVVYGPVNDAKVRRTIISGVGSIDLDGQIVSLWGAGKSGMEIGPGANTGTGSTYPRNVSIEDVRVSGDLKHCDFGVRRRGGTAIRVARIAVSDCAKAMTTDN